MTPEKFAVVVFEESPEEEVELIPTSWLVEQENKCWWPPFKKAHKVTKAVQEMWEPKDSWSLYSIRVLAKCYDYVSGRTLARRAEIASDIQSEGEYGRGHRRIKPVHLNSDSSESSDSSVKHKQRKVIDLPEPPLIQDLEDQSNAASSEHYSSAMIAKAIKPVLVAVTKSEAIMERQEKMFAEVLNLVKNIKKQLDKTSAVTAVPDISVLDKFLPLTTYQAMTAFEEKFTTDPDFKLTLEHRLRLLGGTTVKAAVKYMIDCCLSSSLQHQFNWEGRLGWKTKTNECKKGFKNTHLCELMMSVLVNKQNLETDEAEVRKTIMVYLRNAGDRCSGRKRPSNLDDK